MGKTSRIEIKTNEKTKVTEVFIDGNKINGVRSLKFEQYGRNIPNLVLDLNAVDLSVDCVAISQHEGFDPATSFWVSNHVV